MKLLYKPFGFLMGFLAGMISKKIAAQVWAMIDEEEPPGPTTRDAKLAKLFGAAAIQGAIFYVVRTAVSRGGAKGVHYLTGVWPGEKRPDPA